MDEKNFNDKVTIALNNVKKRLMTDAEALAEKKYYEETQMPEPKTIIEKIIRSEKCRFND